MIEYWLLFDYGEYAICQSIVSSNIKLQRWLRPQVIIATRYGLWLDQIAHSPRIRANPNKSW